MDSGPTGLHAVVVVGAGAAGIGAGWALARSGVPYIILEASSRVGGRAYTDVTSVGHLFDHGCHWFHSADKNPLRVLADQLGHRYHVPTGRRLRPICLDGHWAESTERAAINEIIFGMFDEIEAAAKNSGPDRPVSELLDFGGRFGPLRRHWIELLECAAPEDVSVKDAGRYQDSGVNYPVTDGYGRLMERLAEGLQIRFNCPVSGVGSRQDSVMLSGDFGTVRCQAAIVTASLGVLASGSIRFDPQPDPQFASALADITMGHYEKAVIAFDRPVLTAPDAPASFYCDIVEPSRADDLPLNFEIHPFGRPIAISHLAGQSLDGLLAREGKAGLIDLTVNKLVTAFGSDLRRHIVAATVTGWTDNPYIRGGYAVARPGGAASRQTLIDGRLSDRVHLAGEACHPYWYATAHGAFLTGIDRAERVLKALGHQPHSSPWTSDAAFPI